MSETGHAAAKLTKNQSYVFDALNGADCPMSAYDILDEVRDKGVKAPLQVYRALEHLMERGFVHKLESQNAFVACRHPSCDADEAAHKSVAFMICEKCGQVREISDTTLAERLQDLAGAAKFALDQSVIELRGRCMRCRDV